MSEINNIEIAMISEIIKPTKKPVLSDKIQKHMTFGIWLLNKLIEGGIIGDVPINNIHTFLKITGSTIEEQKHFYEEFDENYKNYNIEFKEIIKEDNKKVSKGKSKKVIVQEEERDELVDQLSDLANNKIATVPKEKVVKEKVVKEKVVKEKVVKEKVVKEKVVKEKVVKKKDSTPVVVADVPVVVTDLPVVVTDAPVVVADVPVVVTDVPVVVADVQVVVTDVPVSITDKQAVVADIPVSITDVQVVVSDIKNDVKVVKEKVVKEKVVKEKVVKEKVVKEKVVKDKVVKEKVVKEKVVKVKDEIIENVVSPELVSEIIPDTNETLSRDELLDDISAKLSEIKADEDEDEDNIDTYEIIVNGVLYLKDDDDHIYDVDTNDEIGTYDPENEIVKLYSE
jgi:hypothetical protein